MNQNPQKKQQDLAPLLFHWLPQMNRAPPNEQMEIAHRRQPFSHLL